MGDIRILYIGLIRSVVEDERIILQGEVHPLTQLLFANDSTRGIVRIAQIDDVHVFPLGNGGYEVVLCCTRHIDIHVFPLGNGGYEVVLCCTGHIHDIGPAAVFECAAAPNHDV